VTDSTVRDGMSTAGVRARVGDLLAGMNLAEKVGQLTQLYYFGSREQVEGPPRQRPDEVVDALARGGVGSLLFVTDPAEINRLQRLGIEGNSHGIPAHPHGRRCPCHRQDLMRSMRRRTLRHPWRNAVSRSARGDETGRCGSGLAEVIREPLIEALPRLSARHVRLGQAEPGLACQDRRYASSP
jgi:hypothetical protein